MTMTAVGPKRRLWAERKFKADRKTDLQARLCCDKRSSRKLAQSKSEMYCKEEINEATENARRV